MPQPPSLQRRQDPRPIGSDVVYDGDGWYSPTTYIVKWSLIGAIIGLFFIFVLVGYLHAQRRMKKGLRPLAYHSWLVPRRQRMLFNPTYQNQYMPYPINREQDGYAMHGYAPPPPVYDRINHENAPAYLPPEGASKVNPDQGDYAATPPPGAPPMRTDEAPAYPAPVVGASTRDQV